MTQTARRDQPEERAASAGGATKPRVPRRGDLGFGALIVAPEAIPGPTTSASWAASMWRFARALVWMLPLYAICYGLVTLGQWNEKDPAHYLTGNRPLHLVGWLAAVWLGLMSLVVVAALLSATRSRHTAGTGLMLGVAGVALMLPFSALPGQTPIGGRDAHTFVLAGATIYSLAWMVTGWGVARCGALATGDGVVLMLAAPMLGVAGLLIGPLQSVGALLIFAAGIGIAGRAGRLSETNPIIASSR